MQNSLFRRRLAVRACFNVLLEREIIPSSSPTTTADDLTTSLLTHRMFVFFSSFSFHLKLKFRSRSTAPMLVVTRIISGSNLPEPHKRELLDVGYCFLK